MANEVEIASCVYCVLYLPLGQAPQRLLNAAIGKVSVRDERIDGGPVSVLSFLLVTQMCVKPFLHVFSLEECY